MIPIEPKDDGFKAAKGLMNAALICCIGWGVILAIVALLFGCSSSSEAQIEPRLDALEQEVNAEAALRFSALQKVNEHISLGALIARYNPALTIGEIYRLGRAIDAAAVRHGLDPKLIASVIVVESHGRAKAVSEKGAIGVMQIMPYWLDELGIDGDLSDVETNVNIGAFILADNIRRWDRDEGLRRYVAGNGPGGRAYVRRVKFVLAEMRKVKYAA